MIPEPAPSVIAVARRFADQAGLAIEQAERRRAQEETRALQAVTEALAAAATPSDVGLAIVRQGVKALGARAATVYALREDGEGLELIASEGYPAETDERLGADPARACRRRSPTRSAAARSSSARRPRRSPRGTRGSTTSDESFVAAPLVAGGPRDRRHLHRLGRGAPVRRRPEPRSSASRARRPRRSTGPSCSSASGPRRAGCASSRPSPRRSRRPSPIEDVSRTCLEHAATGVGASAGLVVLPRPRRATPRSAGSSSSRRSGSTRPRRRDPGRGRGADRRVPAAAAGRRRPTTAGSRSRSRAARSRCSCRRSARSSDADREWLAHARQPGRAGARPRRPLRDRARDRRDDAAQRPAGAPAVGQRRHARGALPAGHGRRRRRRRLVRRDPARGRLASGSSSATSSARASRRRR